MWIFYSKLMISFRNIVKEEIAVYKWQVSRFVLVQKRCFLTVILTIDKSKIKHFFSKKTYPHSVYNLPNSFIFKATL